MSVEPPSARARPEPPDDPSWLSWVWLVQVLFFLFGGLSFLLAPRWTLAFLTWSSPHPLPAVGVEQVRHLGGYTTLMMLASALGLLRRDPTFRQGLALCFAIFFTLWSGVFWFNELHAPGRYGWGGALLFGVPGPITGLANWLYYLSQRPGRLTWFLDTQSSATARPSSLWLVWIVQAVFGALLTLALLLFPGAVMSALGGATPPQTAEQLGLIIDQFRMVSPYPILLGMLSLYASVQTREWIWREFGWAFGVTTLTLGLAVLWSRAAGGTNNWAFLLAAIYLGFAVANIAQVRVSEPRLSLSRQETPEGWLALDLVAGPMMALQTLMTKRRASHLMGVGAQGRFQVWGPDEGAREAAEAAALAAALGDAARPEDAAAEAAAEAALALCDAADRQALESAAARAFREADDEGRGRGEPREARARDGARAAVRAAYAQAAPFPPHDLFDPGRRFPLQVRFANLTELDDAALDVRGASLRLSRESDGSPFDLLLNTGSFSPVRDIVVFAAFVGSKFLPEWSSKVIVESDHRSLEGAVAGLRRAPESYGLLYYYTQKVTWWIDASGRRHLVRYRLRPPGVVEDDQIGLPTDEDAAHVWARERLQTEFRPSDYLREEMKRRLADGEVTLQLEAQFHAQQEGDTLSWYDSTLDWDPVSHPWTPLGTLTLGEALPDAQTELLCFNPANRPLSLGAPPSDGPFDPRSIADSEWRVVTKLQRLRLWMYRAMGLPRFGDVSDR